MENTKPIPELDERRRADDLRHKRMLREAPAFPYQEDDNYHAAEGISTHLYVATHLLQGLLAKHSTSVRSPLNDALVTEALELAKILIGGCD